MLIGIIALTTELTEYEEVAKIVVIPSMVLLIIVTGYAIFKTAYSQHWARLSDYASCFRPAIETLHILGFSSLSRKSVNLELASQYPLVNLIHYLSSRR